MDPGTCVTSGQQNSELPGQGWHNTNTGSTLHAVSSRSGLIHDIVMVNQQVGL